MLNLVIRQETVTDHKAVYELIKAAFEKAEYADGDEQDLVKRLRHSEAFIPELSIVAECESELVGHIFFTKIKIGTHPSLALAPLAVLPAYQGKGVGGNLILAGHKIAKDLGFGSVTVLGHATYYPRFGYVPASKWGIKAPPEVAPFEVPDDCFMTLELLENGLKDVSGVVKYAKGFFKA